MLNRGIITMFYGNSKPKFYIHLMQKFKYFEQNAFFKHKCMYLNNILDRNYNLAGNCSILQCISTTYRTDKVIVHGQMVIKCMVIP